MSETRHCKGYLVNCKNPAVKGRLFCFTCAGRKSRNKKTLALETCERDVKELRAKLEDVSAELEHWKEMAMKLRASEESTKQELKSLKKSNSNAAVNSMNLVASRQPSPTLADMMEIDISSAASALLSIGTPMRKSFITQHPNPVVPTSDWIMVTNVAVASHIAPAN